ncbi:unnamed protein product [Vitrella brassicaformis CCMP3155]|uniref:Uncharacterized protein n=1 Tax=Vitrella brassicaformis (strain CCMP3155) TaxID=1169540 RepID=A0A0G4GBY2_VITBC|nr:unnamed protein product [Vitrella brassicaformis CCMP3155]|eukprot:CEM26656.1 unnamed protein product [Vitrella brassicaformis CCMP3155]
MSEGQDTHMASAADTEAMWVQVATQVRLCDGGDADLLREEEDGEMAEEEEEEEEEEGLQAAADSESESDGVQDDSDNDDGPLGDGIDDDDYDDYDDGYEEDGHPVVVATTVEVPDGFGGANDIEARFPHDTDSLTKELTLGIIGRTISAPQHATDLIEQGADPHVVPRLRQKGSGCAGIPYSLVHLAIDNKSDYAVPTIHASDDGYERPVALPHWSSDKLQSAILAALINQGADPNATADDEEDLVRPIRRAIASGDQTAFDVLTARPDIDLPAQDGAVMVMALPRPLSDPPPDYQEVLLSMFREVIARDPTLATERRFDENLVHLAAVWAKGNYPQSFINSYLDLITTNGADMTAASGGGWTPLHEAALHDSLYVADSLCRKLPAADQINRRTVLGETPLAIATGWLDHHTQELQDPETPEADKEECRAGSDKYKLIIAACCGRGPTSTPSPRPQRRTAVSASWC